MRESYGEGVASRTGPESCVAARKGGGEALTGVRMGTVSSREIVGSGVPTQLTDAEGDTRWGEGARPDRARPSETSRGRRPVARTEASCARTGRSPRRPGMAPRAASARPKVATR